MNKLLLILSLLMGVVVLISNFLVQFPVNYFDLLKFLLMELLPILLLF